MRRKPRSKQTPKPSSSSTSRSSAPAARLTEESSRAASSSRPDTPARPAASPAPPPRADAGTHRQASLDAADIFDSGAIDYARFLTFPNFEELYEPQGELLEEFQTQREQQFISDFVLPFPIQEPLPETLLSTESIAVDTPDHSSLGLATVTTPRPSSNTASQPRPASPARKGAMASITSLQTSSASLKRKSDADAASAITLGDAQPSPKKSQKARASTGDIASSRPEVGTRTRSLQTDLFGESGEMDEEDPMSAGPSAGGSGQALSGAEKSSGSSTSRRIPETIASRFSNILPAGKVFPIQIGSELFRLSGASLSSDAPSYFSHFFSEQLLNNAGKSGNIRTLYIDRDPATFRDISLHLQGYHVRPRNGEHYVRLFADAQFYSLPRLTQQLFKTDIYIQIGDRDFQIPRDLFSGPGNSPNFFSLGFAHFFSTPSEVFPGLDRTSLLRPPSIQPPSVPNRSGDVFADLLRLLQGYPVHIRDEYHRQDLLRDARYFHLKGLEQQLIPCDVSFNLARRTTEIVVRLEDVRQSGVSFTPDPESDTSASSRDIASAAGGGPAGQDKPSASASINSSSAASPETGMRKQQSGSISYARPFTDETSHVLIIEISSTEATLIDLSSMRATFTGQTKARIASLFQVIANKMNLPVTQPLGLMMLERGGGIAAMPVSLSNSGVSGDRVCVEISHDAWCEVDGAVIDWEEARSPSMTGTGDDTQRRLSLPPVRSWQPNRNNLEVVVNTLGEWVVTKAQWKLRVQPADDDVRIVEVVMQAVRIQAHSCEKSRNAQRGFLV